MHPNEKIVFADSLRGVACCCVVVAHTGMFWTWPGLAARLLNSSDFPAGTSWPLLSHVVLAIPGFNAGVFGVALFFVISGFVIPFSFTRYSGPAFVVARAWRLIPAYVACFTVTVGAIMASSAFYDRAFPYDGRAVAFHAIPGLRMVVGSPAIDPVIWTLEIEVLFYAVCALAAPWLRPASRLTFAVPAGVLAAVLALTPAGGSTSTVLSYAPYVIFMFVGTAISFHRRGAFTNLELALTMAILLGAAAFAHVWVGGANLMAYAAPYSAAVAVFLCCYGMGDRFPRVAILGWLSRISYPLYAVHAILGFLVMRVLLDCGMNSDLASAVAIGAALIVAAMVHKIVEVPSQVLGRRLGKALTGAAYWNPLHSGASAAAVTRKFPPPATQPLVARPAALR